jgi:putative dimethyl sulfoxide reductase chaperone
MEPVSDERQELILLGQFLAYSFRRPPAANELAGLVDLLTELPMAPANPDMAQGATLLAEYAGQARGTTPDHAAAALREDWEVLFEGPGPIAAPPWESVYRTTDQVLFGPTTLAVRKAYQRWGFSLGDAAGHEPEDHIATELEFLVRLLAAEAAEPRAAAERKHFVQEHLLRWVSPFATLVEDRAETLYYQGVARLLPGYLQACAGL